MLIHQENELLFSVHQQDQITFAASLECFQDTIFIFTRSDFTVSKNINIKWKYICFEERQRKR